MAKHDDPYGDYMRELELKFQQMADREDEALFKRLKATCYKASATDIRGFIVAVRQLGLKKGMTHSEARTWAIEMITSLLDSNDFLPNLDVKPEPDAEAPVVSS